jgi:Asp-tRNA(Asn)/Glu-tRNA(Gln) amidotransferase A subunit family amidase
LRVAYTEDFGCCDVDDDIRASFAAKIAAMRHLFARCDEVSLDWARRTAASTCCAPKPLWPAREAYERDPDSLGPNPRANYEMGRMSLLDSAWAQAEQTRILLRFQQVYADYDLLLTPTTPVSPFPWTLLHAELIDGKAQANYYRWLALTYVITLTTHPAISLPCGRRGHALRAAGGGAFPGRPGLAVGGPRPGAGLAGLPGLQRPRPDLGALQAPVPALDSLVTHPPEVPHTARSVVAGATQSVV